jgi:hypothetical protein
MKLFNLVAVKETGERWLFQLQGETLSDVIAEINHNEIFFEGNQVSLSIELAD